ncbi:stage V sporulation protein AE [Ferroacidibacillus organovorans]|uniref:Stage V sporulation protein AE n=1 Tax=Ferroacidibacillus organovorans TaxID=1765683 RepID=A0A1V4EUI4_9BACL|nr:stage V sporulation protein AE [Ferroacidibacillus organovorans]OPG16617.1 hypothetical protein B2M26_07085 [Ferroacidibacillus organovorans]
MNKKRVILVTDGDIVAQRTLEYVAKELGARVISRSGGHPTPLSGEDVLRCILMTPHDPVIVMVDDNGSRGQGPGEHVLKDLCFDHRIVVIGILAVASDTRYVRGVKIDFSVDRNGRIVDAAVNKNGYRLRSKRKVLFGDTVDILRKIHSPILIGIGDIGKMRGADHFRRGYPVTKEALRIIIELDRTRPCVRVPATL